MEAKGESVGKAADPQLVEAATKFVSEVIEKAKEEAGRRRTQNKAGTRTSADGEGEAGTRKVRQGTLPSGAAPGIGIPWHSRARGLLARLLSSLCFRGTSADIPKSS